MLKSLTCARVAANAANGHANSKAMHHDAEAAAAKPAAPASGAPPSMPNSEQGSSRVGGSEGAGGASKAPAWGDKGVQAGQDEQAEQLIKQIWSVTDAALAGEQQPIGGLAASVAEVGQQEEDPQRRGRVGGDGDGRGEGENRGNGPASTVQIGVGGGAGGGGGHIPQKVPILQVDSSEVEATVLGLCKQGV